MIGQYDKQVHPNDVSYRDQTEIVALRVMMLGKDAWKKKTGKSVFAISDAVALRDGWTRNGQPVMPSSMKVTQTDYLNLLADMGYSVPVLNSPEDKKLRADIVKIYNDTKAEYDSGAKKKEYLHAMTDPELRAQCYPVDLPKAAYVVHKGKSLRETVSGETVRLYDKTGTKLQYTEAVRGNPFDAATTPVTTRSTSVTPAPAAINEKPKPAPRITEYIGWENRQGENGETIYGLSHLLGAYVTKAEGQFLAKNIDADMVYPAEIAARSQALLRGFRSKGYDFSVKEKSKRNEIEVRMAGVNRVDVRVMDASEDGKFIGRVYDGVNNYYSNPPKTLTVNYGVNDALAIVDFVMGHVDFQNLSRSGKDSLRASTKTGSSNLALQGMSSGNRVHVKPVVGAYRAVLFAGQDDAKEYLEKAISDSQEFMDNTFDHEGVQKAIDEALREHNLRTNSSDSPSMYESDKIKLQREIIEEKMKSVYSRHPMVKDVQMKAAELAVPSWKGGDEVLAQLTKDAVGNLEDGFNPTFVLSHMVPTERGNDRDAMVAALKVLDYDIKKLKGDDFSGNNIKDRTIAFNQARAKTLNEIDHPMLRAVLQDVEKKLTLAGIVDQEKKTGKASVAIDNQGIIQWKGSRPSGTKASPWQDISGEIGQIFVPDENGIIKTNFKGDNNFGFVPGYTGYFAFDEANTDPARRMERFRAKGFEQHLMEEVSATLASQLVMPYDSTLKNIPAVLDATKLNRLYTTETYGKRIDPDFMENMNLSDTDKKAVLKTLSSRVRFDNAYSDHATTHAESRANADKTEEDSSAFDYWENAGEKNMRVLHEDLTNYADLTMTGTGKTQGLIWYLTDGAKVNKDGTVTPSKGILQADGTYAPDKTAVKKLDYFKFEEHNAWDRTQMSSNQLMTALKVDKKVGVALMTFGGWTFDDSYAVSLDFAERNKIQGMKPTEDSMRVLDNLIGRISAFPDYTDDYIRDFHKDTGMSWKKDILAKGMEMQEACMAPDREERARNREAYQAFLEEHGTFRPLQRGDKISDFGGNKGTIGIVIDRNMDPEEAKKLKLEDEVAFLKANPELDVIGAPYSMISRHNAGVVHELQEGGVKDLYNPKTGETLKGAMGHLNVIITDMQVDHKTKAYSEEDVLEGKGRKASGQLAWALQSLGCDAILDEIYGGSDHAWESYREYLITTGLDMAPDGTILPEYTPHPGEDRFVFKFDPNKTKAEFLEEIQNQGGFLEVPGVVTYKNERETNLIPVLSPSLRRDTELLDGTLKPHDFTNNYLNIYEQMQYIHTLEQGTIPKELFPGKDDKTGQLKKSLDEILAESYGKIQENFDNIQQTIIDRQFDGGANGKHSYLRDNIMGRRMKDSATGVAIVDPRLKIGEAGMNREMMDALNVKTGDMVMAFRDPVWRSGAVRSFIVKEDDTVHGIAINPIADKSHDMDFDGDTMGIMKLSSKAAQKEMREKLAHYNNMVDKGSGKDSLYFQIGMDLISAEKRALEKGDDRATKLMEDVKKQMDAPEEHVRKNACIKLTEYSRILFREHGIGAAHVDLRNTETVEASFMKMAEEGAKGSPKKVAAYMKYHNGEKTMKDARDIAYATGVKVDDTGLSGANGQKAVSVMRNQNITAALEVTYPLTQAVLQIKHDADMARVINDKLNQDLPMILAGRDPENPKMKLTPATFQNRFTKLMVNDLDVPVSPAYVEELAKGMTHNGELISLKDAMNIKASPMDKVAYGGGYAALNELATNKRSLLEGDWNRMFAPRSMRNVTDETALIKKDTLTPERKEELIAEKKEKALAKKTGLRDMKGQQVSLFDSNGNYKGPRTTGSAEIAVQDAQDLGPEP